MLDGDGPVGPRRNVPFGWIYQITKHSRLDILAIFASVGPPPGNPVSCLLDVTSGDIPFLDYSAVAFSSRDEFFYLSNGNLYRSDASSWTPERSGLTASPNAILVAEEVTENVEYIVPQDDRVWLVTATQLLKACESRLEPIHKWHAGVERVAKAGDMLFVRLPNRAVEAIDTDLPRSHTMIATSAVPLGMDAVCSAVADDRSGVLLVAAEDGNLTRFKWTK